MAEWLPGRTVLVAGVRLAGTAAARAALARGATVLLADRERTPEVTALESAGAEFAGDPDRLPAGLDLVVTSPGWRPDHPLLVAAARAGVEVLGEVEFAWRLRGPGAAPWLAVTGTNGKTTTVRMLESILLAAGKRALAVGNVGVSVIDAVAASPSYEVLAVELSSFQLRWSSTIRPAAGALLNLAPDHLDWHGSMTAYADAKTRVWNSPIAIANVDDPHVAELFAGSASRARGRRVGITRGIPAGGQLGVVEDTLVDRAFADDAVLLFEADQVRPPGGHNVANALAAAALARALGVPAAAVSTGLRSFMPDPHRNELIGEYDGVRYVDDSKATNPHAAAASLSAYRPVVWIAGGQLKDAPVDELVRTVADRLLGVVLLGVDRAQIFSALARHAPQVPVIDVATDHDGAMIEVVRAAVGLARPGATVLLAPAAASYDMFTGYAARGDAFAAAVRTLRTP
jgi:UDP-N-acetylmuramoylalanine--D-glutamate ligase